MRTLDLIIAIKAFIVCFVNGIPIYGKDFKDVKDNIKARTEKNRIR